jgi:tRNA threonylcarbamoyladenosine modification (KEOPS) complex Cgi121 subunit
VDGLGPLLPGAGAVGVLAVVIGALIKFLVNDRRLLTLADSRYRAEVADHEATQKALDEERRARRKAEDQHGEVLREVAGLRDQIRRLEHQVAALSPGGAT